MKLQLLTLLLLLFIPRAMNAQPYKYAFGIKAGYSNGITAIVMVDRELALEAQGLYNQYGFQATLLYQYRFSPYAKKRLYYYFGGGPHFGRWDIDYALGAAILAGSEYVFRKAPVAAGVEWKPMINFYKKFGYVIPDLAATFRVYFK